MTYTDFAPTTEENFNKAVRQIGRAGVKFQRNCRWTYPHWNLKHEDQPYAYTDRGEKWSLQWDAKGEAYLWEDGDKPEKLSIHCGNGAQRIVAEAFEKNGIRAEIVDNNVHVYIFNH